MRETKQRHGDSKRKRTYAAELSLLAETYETARRIRNPDLERLLERVADAPAVFVASGGAFAVAQLAADLHEHYTGHVARAVTPLEFSATPLHAETAAIMFTASGRHPDALMAVAAAKAALCSVIGVVTLKEEAQLAPALRGDRVQVVTIASVIEKDGFLATNSVLAMSTALVRARLHEDDLPSSLPLLALRSVRDRLEAREICPVLPFPAAHPRRGDDLMTLYRQLLLEETEIDLRDIIYADEHNPFDLYRTLSRLHARYTETLRPIGDVKVILSAHSSKLLSLGVLLAAFEHQLPVVSAPPTGYALADGFDREALERHHQLVCLWLEGSPYQ